MFSCQFKDEHASLAIAELRTISSRTSPDENDSPSFFFHDAIPPSVIVGDIAGIVNLVTARLWGVECIAARALASAPVAA
jgi:hypothetical protein